MSGVPLLSMLQAWGPWAVPGWLMLMFALAWMAAARLFGGQRMPVTLIVAANVCGGLSLLLGAAGGRGAGGPAWVLPGVLELWAQALLWQVGLALSEQRRQGWEPMATAAGLSVMLLLWPGEPAAVQGAGPPALALGGAWLALRGGWQLARRLVQGGNVAPARAVAALTAGMALAHLLRLRGTVDAGGHLALAWFGEFMLPVAFLANIIVAHAVFGPLLRQLQQLTQRDPLTGLPDEATVLRALDFEWHRPARRGRRPALLVASPDALSDIAASWGTATRDALLVELARLLRSGLPAGCVLGHAGDGRFLVLVPASTHHDAQRHAEALVRRVADEADLHPEAGRMLSLSVGVALREADDVTPRAMQTRAELQRLCAALAGGNRAESAGLVRLMPPI